MTSLARPRSRGLRGNEGPFGWLFTLPAILILSGFAVMSDNVGGGFVMLLIGAGLAYIWYQVSWIPRWKHNRRDLK
mgnify:CR=1 FL=1